MMKMSFWKQHGQHCAAADMHENPWGKKENFENFETTPGWASKTSLLGSGPSGGPLGVTFGAKIENLCENHML